ncbi:hypothetical protein CWE11_11790, partial [Aliidiomarina sanyensis]
MTDIQRDSLHSDIEVNRASKHRGDVAVVIDDDPSSLQISCWLLKRDGYRVIGLSSLAELNDFLAIPESHVSVFVIDFSLEDSTAIELINTLQQTPSYAFVPKVVITGHRDHL